MMSAHRIMSIHDVCVTDTTNMMYHWAPFMWHIQFGLYIYNDECAQNYYKYEFGDRYEARCHTYVVYCISLAPCIQYMYSWDCIFIVMSVHRDVIHTNSATRLTHDVTHTSYVIYRLAPCTYADQVGQELATISRLPKNIGIFCKNVL